MLKNLIKYFWRELFGESTEKQQANHIYEWPYRFKFTVYCISFFFFIFCNNKIRCACFMIKPKNQFL